MGILEIVLLIVGTVVLALGYILPVRREDKSVAAPQVDEEQIKKMVEDEVDHAKTQIRDIVEETVTYSMEKTERAMERLTNEKIMAVNEYSDTVLETIHTNHKETVFLYDMLNEKHDELVTTVSTATQTIKEIRATLPAVKGEDAAPKKARSKKARGPLSQEEAAVQTTGAAGGISTAAPEEPLWRDETVVASKAGGFTGEGRTGVTDERRDTTLVPEYGRETEETDFIPISPERVTVIGGTVAANGPEESNDRKETDFPGMDITFDGRGENNNEKILSLHKAGKSKTAIARELGLGVGEVKLVIDLFEGAG